MSSSGYPFVCSCSVSFFGSFLSGVYSGIKSTENTVRTTVSYENGPYRVLKIWNRRGKDVQVLRPRLLGSPGFIPGFANALSVNILGFYLGSDSVSLYAEYTIGGLWPIRKRASRSEKVRALDDHFAAAESKTSSFLLRLSSVLSMNAAMSASVVLASRLRDDISVFALMLFSIQMFALLPILRTRLLVRVLLHCFLVIR